MPVAEFVDANAGEVRALLACVDGMPLCRCVLLHIANVCGEPMETSVQFRHTCGGGGVTATIDGPMHGFVPSVRTTRVAACGGDCLQQHEARVSAYLMRKSFASNVLDVL